MGWRRGAPELPWSSACSHGAARSSGTAAGCGGPLRWGERRDGRGNSPLPLCLPFKKLGAEGAWVCSPVTWADSLSGGTGSRLPCWRHHGHGGGTQKDFGAVGSTVGTAEHRRRWPGPGGQEMPLVWRAGQDLPCSRCRRGGLQCPHRKDCFSSALPGTNCRSLPYKTNRERPAWR